MCVSPRFAAGGELRVKTPAEAPVISTKTFESWEEQASWLTVEETRPEKVKGLLSS